MAISPPDVEAYARDRSPGLDPLLDELIAETHEKTEYPGMISGRLGGGLLRMVALMTGARRALEVGMFTGYSALVVASALPDDGELVSCELSPEYAAIAQRYFNRAPYGHKIRVELGPAAESLGRLQGPFDMAFIDADKVGYDTYYEACLKLLRPGGVILIDNVLWSGRVLDPQDEATIAIDTLNRKIEQDERVDRVLLTVRDGIFLIRKRIT